MKTKPKPGRKRTVTTENFGAMLIEAMKEVVAHQRGEIMLPERRMPLDRRAAEVAPPPQYDAQMIASIRKKCGLSQPVFANVLNVSASAIRAWERGARVPEGPSLRLLEVADRNPEALLLHISTPSRSGARETTDGHAAQHVQDARL